MMGFFFSMFFLIPFFSYLGFFIPQFLFLFLCLTFIFSYVCDFYCNLSYMFGCDLFSLGLVLLTFLICSLMILCSLNFYSSSHYYFFLMLIFFLLLILNLFFFSLSIFYFYLFFEFMLIPIFFLIIGLGYTPERLISGLYLFFYTIFGSLPFFFMVLNTYFMFSTCFFDLIFLFNLNFFTHLFFLFSFFIKLPMFIIHFWLPSAHVQAPVSGSMILAGLMLKVGGYGLIRFFFLMENSILNYGYIWFSFSIYGSFLVSLICFFQGDLKSLIAYSSISHMGLCLIGFLSLSSWGVMGSYFLMLSHGLCSSCLFMISSFFYDRIHSRSFFINSGLISFFPNLIPFWMLMCFFNMGCPPSLNFLSEIMILNSMIMYFYYSYYYFLLISFFCSCFSFYMFSYISHGLYHNYYSFSFISVREYLLILIHLVPLIMIIFFVNLFI